jgi:DNA-binding PadR family transcriptional regulator
MSTRNLSELEGATLGLLCLHAPCTPYKVRRLFMQSPSAYWSGSAGAIYPLFNRMEKRNFITCKQERAGRRARSYRLTDAGIAALKRWVADSESTDVCGIPMDPLRTRGRFLALLSTAQRMEYIRKAKAELKVQLKVITTHCYDRKKTGDTFAYLTSLGAMLMAEARVKWMREVEKTISKM